MNGYQVWSKNFFPITACLLIFVIFFAIFLFPKKYLSSYETNSTTLGEGCAPEKDYKTTNITISAQSYSYQNADDDSKIVMGADVAYKRLKKSVPIDRNSLTQPGHWLKGPVVTGTNNIKYQVFYPDNDTDTKLTDRKKGYSYPFEAPNGQTEFVKFYRHGIIAAVHLTDSGDPLAIDGFNNSYSDPQVFWIADIFWDSNKEDLPPEVIECKNLSSSAQLGILLKKPADDNAGNTGQSVRFGTNAQITIPSQKPSQTNQELQHEWFVFREDPSFKNVWWTPHCKPAIYLYPPEKTLVNVKVHTKGFLTYVDPPYDSKKGWTVEAYPDGKLVSSRQSLESRFYDYLYYESKMGDEYIRKPERGWVIRSLQLPESNLQEITSKPGMEIAGQTGFVNLDWYSPLEEHFNKVLPELGLNSQQTKDFIDYWRVALPYSPYYFVGVMDQENIDYIEPLEITPRPDYVNRVRIYFERLDEFKEVKQPQIVSSLQSQESREYNPGPWSLATGDFKVVEWGGMVKNDPNHPFTCSQ